MKLTQAVLMSACMALADAKFLGAPRATITEIADSTPIVVEPVETPTVPVTVDSLVNEVETIKPVEEVVIVPKVDPAVIKQQEEERRKKEAEAQKKAEEEARQ